MVIRITNQLFTSNLFEGSNLASNKILQLRDQITSGRKISTASEDPLSSIQILNMNTQLAKLGDWSKNISTAKEEAKMSYDNLSSLYDQLQAIDDLAIEAANETNDKSQIEALLTEIQARTKTIVNLANSKYGDNYIFAGTNTQTKPYELDETTMSVTYHGTASTDEWRRKTETMEGEETTMNLLGENIFGDGTTGLFASLTSINTAMSADPTDFDSIRAELDNLKAGLKKVSGAMAEASNIVTSMNLSAEVNETSDLSLTESRSLLRDTNVVEATTELIMAQTALEASYQVSAAMLNRPSLLDYI